MSGAIDVERRVDLVHFTNDLIVFGFLADEFGLHLILLQARISLPDDSFRLGELSSLLCDPHVRYRERLANVPTDARLHNQKFMRLFLGPRR